MTFTNIVYQNQRPPLPINIVDYTPISAVILTRDEADNIKRCLRSLLWCEDVIMIDASTDETRELARSLAGVEQLQIVRETKISDFAKLRNLALSKVKHDWVLFVDADEVISMKLRDEIKTAIQSSTVAGYLIPRRDYFLGKWLRYGETGRIAHLKLGRKTAGKWRRSVHEVWEITGEIKKLREPLLHYPHPTVAEFVQRINRWTTLNAVEFEKLNKPVTFWQVLLYPSGKFFLNYFLRLGFLDGIPGFIMTTMMSFHSFLTRAKLYLLQQKSVSSA